MMKKDNEDKKNTILGKVSTKKVGVAASSIAVVAAGTVLAVSAYQSDQSFDPESAGEIQSNQVVFSDEEHSSGNDQKDKKDQSHSIDNNTEKNDTKTQLDAGSDYLFDNGQLAQNVAVVNPSNPGADVIPNNPGQNPGTIYDISGSGDGTDTIISGNTGTGDNTSTPGGNGGSGNGGTGNNGNGGNGNGSGTETKPSVTIKDPVVNKDKPSGGSEYVIDKPYSDTNKPAGDKEYFVYIEPLYDWGHQSSIRDRRLPIMKYTVIWIHMYMRCRTGLAAPGIIGHKNTMEIMDISR